MTVHLRTFVSSELEDLEPMTPEGESQAFHIRLQKLMRLLIQVMEKLARCTGEPRYKQL